MTLRLRLALLVLLVTALVSFALFVAGAPDRAGAGRPRRWQSSAQCKPCHAEVWAEWEGSHHQIAYRNPEVRKLSDDFRNKECQACHLPRPISVTGPGRRTLPRLTRPDEGVGCLTCHLGRDGGILARRDVAGAACRPRRSPDLLSVELCASCHNQHGTTDQWRASHYARDGVDCNDCHMPAADRTGGRGRDHRFPGAHDPAMLRAAARFDLRRDGKDVVATLENRGAGHNLPTEERHRAVDIVCRFVVAGRPTSWQRVYRFRQPYRDEPGENTQLPAGAKKAVRIPIPEGATQVVARLWYRLTPFVGDDDPKSSLVAETELDLE